MADNECIGLGDPYAINQAYETETVILFQKELYMVHSILSPYDPFKLERLIWDLNCFIRPAVFYKCIIHLIRMVSSDYPNISSIPTHVSKILLLVKCCPACLHESDDQNQGDLIIHWACKFSTLFPIELFETLVFLARDSCAKGNYVRMNCLDYLLQTQYSVEVLDLIIKICPSALRTGNDNGRLPIHVLFTSSFDGKLLHSDFNKSLQLMIDADPELLFCEYTCVIYRLGWNSAGSTFREEAIETWTPMSKSRKAGNEMLNKAVESVLCKYALNRCQGHPSI